MDEGDPDIDAGELAEEFVDGLLNSFGATFEVDRRDLDDDTVEIAVSGDDLGLLIGPRGQTLAAVQELARTVVQRQAPAPARGSWSTSPATAWPVARRWSASPGASPSR